MALLSLLVKDPSPIQTCRTRRPSSRGVLKSGDFPVDSHRGRLTLDVWLADEAAHFLRGIRRATGPGGRMRRLRGRIERLSRQFMG